LQVFDKQLQQISDRNQSWILKSLILPLNLLKIMDFLAADLVFLEDNFPTMKKIPTG